VHRTSLMWFRRDLRLADNAALLDAVARAVTIACVHVSPQGRDPHAPGSAFLSRSQASLAALSSSLAEQGCQLILLVGPASEAIPQATSECGATVVTCSRDWTPAGLAEERAVAEALSAAGIELRC
jgi:deoxyribodipyrimidine photo-lyase